MTGYFENKSASNFEVDFFSLKNKLKCEKKANLLRGFAFFIGDSK